MLNRNYSHCEDMYGSSYEPTEDMQTTHQLQEASVIEWINEYLGNKTVSENPRDVTVTK